MPKIMNGYINIRPGGGDTGAPLNMQKRLDLIQRYADLAGRRVIDLGCGTGQYLLALLQFGADAYGVEYAYEKARIFCSRNP